MKPELISTILILLGYTQLESVDGKVFLPSTDIAKLREAYFDKFGSPLILDEISLDEDDNAVLFEQELINLETAFNQESDESDPPAETSTAPAEPPANQTSIKKTLAALTSTVNRLETSLKKEKMRSFRLGSKPEFDYPPSFPSHKNKLNHNKTHLFASNSSFDAFADRPWNQRAAGITATATDYTPIDISKINEDLGAYYRENKIELISFLRNKNRLPKNWNTVSNVQDQIAYAKAFTGEVTQARKKRWLPKSDFEFQPEIAQVDPIQIDIEIAGFELQSLEASWINHLASVNKDGSQPYKMSFVSWLAAEFLKKSAEEDQISHIRGIKIPTALNATVAGKAIHKSEGILKKIQKAQARRVYLPYALGVPTEENIYDYVENFVMRIPEYFRDMPGMVLYMAEYWKLAYLKRREHVRGLVQTYSGDSYLVDRHENITIESLPFMNDSKFMFCTTNDNISILENVPSEKTLLTIEKSKRDIVLMGDYKIGVHVWAFGYEYGPADVIDDSKQIFFSNDVDILPDLYVDVLPNTTVLNAAHHTSFMTGVNTAATAITNILNVPANSYVYILGNSGPHPSTIADAAPFDLVTNITLSQNILIKLFRRTNDFIEIMRWNLNHSNVVFLAPNATTANAALGKHFVTSANTGVTAFTNITNAVIDEVYLIEGGSATNATTIANTGAFSRISSPMTLDAGDWIRVLFNGTHFVELARS